MSNLLSVFPQWKITRDAQNETSVTDYYSTDNNIERAYIILGNVDGTLTGNVRWYLAFFHSLSGSKKWLRDLTSNGSVKYTGQTDADYSSSTNILTPTNGGTLLTLANTTSVKNAFFGGVTQTAASLFAFMQQKYGNYAGFHCSADVNTGGQIGEHYSSNEGTMHSIEVQGGQLAHNSYYAWRFPYDLTASGPEINIPEEYCTSTALMRAYIVFGEGPDPTQLHFDMYVNGTKDPNVTVQWSALSVAENVSLQLVNPIVWGYPDPLTPGLFEPIVEDDGVNVPNDSQWYVMKHAYTWPGKYFNPYISEFNTIEALSDYNTINKVIVYGLDGIANYMHYYLRFNMQVNQDNTGVTTWGKLFDVKVPREPASASDITVTEISGSDNNAIFTTTVTVHFGAPPDDTADDDPTSPSLTDPDGEDSPIGPYDPDYGVPDLDTYDSTGFSGSAVLTKTYAFNAATAANVGSKLWSQSYLDVLKIQNNPIENIISMKWYPMAFTGASNSIKVGDVDFGINGASISSMYTKTVGSFKYTVDSSRPGYLSCSPYTTIKMHLPYCGTVQLDATEILNRTVYVKYIVDLITGDCLVLITLDNSVPYMEVSGKMGVDIPLTASNRMQTELAAASRALSASIGAAGHMLAGDVAGAANEATGIMSFMGQDYATQRTQTHSSACATYANRAIYVEIRRPNWDPSNGYRSRHGRPFHKYVKLSSLTGFVQVDARTTINEAMTEEENRMLEQILTTGFYL